MFLARKIVCLAVVVVVVAAIIASIVAVVLRQNAKKQNDLEPEKQTGFGAVARYFNHQLTTF